MPGVYTTTVEKYWKGVRLFIETKHELEYGPRCTQRLVWYTYKIIDFTPLAFFLAISILVLSTIPFAF